MISQCEFSHAVIQALTRRDHPLESRVTCVSDYFKNAADVKIPLGIKCWRGYVDAQQVTKDVETIVDYFKKQYHLQNTDGDVLGVVKETILNTLCRIHNSNIDCALCTDGKDILIKFDRKLVSLTVIRSAIEQGSKFGWKIVDEALVKKIYLKIEKDDESNITTTRLNMIKIASENVLRTQGYAIENEACEENYLLSTKSMSRNEDKFHRYLCGVVLNVNKKKETSLIMEEYFNIITEKIQKINIDRCSEVCMDKKSSENNAKKIANTFIVYQMLSLKPNVPVILSKLDELEKSIKKATFVLYNNARISAIIDKYATLVLNNECKAIAPIDEVLEFQYITDDESWDLIYNYVMRYPDILKSAVPIFVKNNERKLDFHIHHLWSFLTSLCHKFSSYYRRYRVLLSNVSITEKSWTITSERLYLLRALHVIIKNTLFLLNVEEIDYM